MHTQRPTFRNLLLRPALLVACLGLGLSSLPAAAAAPLAGAPSLDTLAAQADLVVRGMVEDVRYVSSLPTGPEKAQIPYTFVTYRVAQLFKGQLQSPSLTLRFVGGPRPADGAVLSVSGVPQFDVGDHDVLFVRANEAGNCPLVGREKGRLRIIEGRVYSEQGQEVRVDENGNVFGGARRDLPEVMTHWVGSQLYEKARDENPDAEVPNGAISAQQLVQLVEAAVVRAGVAKDARPGAMVSSADPLQAFYAVLPTPVAPPAQ